MVLRDLLPKKVKALQNVEVENVQPTASSSPEPMEDIEQFAVAKDVLICVPGVHNEMNYTTDFFENSVLAWNGKRVPMYAEHADTDTYTAPSVLADGEGNPVVIPGNPKPLPIGFLFLKMNGPNLMGDVYATDPNVMNLYKAGSKMGYSLAWNEKIGPDKMKPGDDVTGKNASLISVAFTLTPAVDTAITPEKTITQLSEANTMVEEKKETVEPVKELAKTEVAPVAPEVKVESETEKLQKELSAMKEALAKKESEFETFKHELACGEKKKKLAEKLAQLKTVMKKKLDKDLSDESAAKLTEEQIDAKIELLNDLKDGVNFGHVPMAPDNTAPTPTKKVAFDAEKYWKEKGI